MHCPSWLKACTRQDPSGPGWPGVGGGDDERPQAPDHLAALAHRCLRPLPMGRDGSSAGLQNAPSGARSRQNSEAAAESMAMEPAPRAAQRRDRSQWGTDDRRAPDWRGPEPTPEGRAPQLQWAAAAAGRPHSSRLSRSQCSRQGAAGGGGFAVVARKREGETVRLASSHSRGFMEPEGGESCGVCRKTGGRLLAYGTCWKSASRRSRLRST
jgi:hypothetical protein